MDNDVELDEYVCNDHGKVYTGNYKQIAAKPWNFGQVSQRLLITYIYLIYDLISSVIYIVLRYINRYINLLYLILTSV